jgi:hypothetical protein
VRKSGVGAVGPHQFQTWQVSIACTPDEELRSEPAVQVGGVDVGEKDEAGCVHKNVPLPAESPLRGVVAPRRAADAGGPHGLAADDGSRRLGLSSLSLTCESTKPVEGMPQRAVEPPTPEVREHRLPRRERGGQHAPGAAGANEVEDRLGHQAPGPLERPSGLRRWRKQRLKGRPFGIG